MSSSTSLQENDDDIGALGSILSWDDEEETARSTSLPTSLLAKDRESNGSAPPDMVQFNNGEFNFLQFGGLTSPHLKPSSTSTTNAPESDALGSLTQRITLQLPLPTPVSALGQSGSGGNDAGHDRQTQQAPTQQTQQVPQQQQQQQQQQPQPTFMLPQGPLMNQLAQLLAQQASNMMQQQQQVGSTAQILQQRLQQAALPQSSSQAQVLHPGAPSTNPPAPQPAQLTQQQQAMLQRIATMQQQAAQQQQQQQQMASEQQQQLSQLQASVVQAQAQAQASITQQQPSQQLQFNADPNALIQQLQFAQLQQQFQAAQAQANSQAMPATQAMKPPQVPVPSNTTVVTSVPATVQDQLKMHFNRAQKQQAVAAPSPVLPRSSNVAMSLPSKRAKPSSKDGSSKPAAKKKPPPSSSSNSAAAPKTTASLVTIDMTSSSGLITASDTDGELSRYAKKSKASEAAARADSPLFDDDDDDDEPHSSDAKAKTNRDRNREHARNTRLRKKAYLEKLKTTVDELCRERDTLVSERAGAANLLVEMHNTRTEVLMSLFALRSTNEKRRELWSSILDESCFACVMPVTPYRSFPASEVQVSKCQRTVMGIDGMIADTSSLHVLFDSLVDRSRCPLGKIEFRYTLITEEAVVAGNQMMARWNMSTVNAVQCGVKMEVSKQGMLCCRFNSGHKITGLELMFDVMAFMLQLKQAAGTDTFSVIPNTVQTCQRTFDKPVVMTLAEPPYTIVQVNKEWEQMTGYTAEEVVGKANCGILQGTKTDRKALDDMMHEIRFKRPFSAILKNVKKSGEVFRNFLLLFPLSTDSRITHYLSITDFTDFPTAGCVQPQQLVHPTAVAAAAAQQQLQQGASRALQGRPSIVPPSVAGILPAVMAASLPTTMNLTTIQQPSVGIGPVNFATSSQAAFASQPALSLTGSSTPTIMPPPPPPPSSSGIKTMSSLKRPHESL